MINKHNLLLFVIEFGSGILLWILIIPNLKALLSMIAGIFATLSLLMSFVHLVNIWEKK